MEHLTAEPIRLEPWHRQPFDEKEGASVEFSGIVRGDDVGARVAALAYEAYEPMAERLIAGYVEQARARWPLRQVRVAHRLGSVPAGAVAVFIGVRASHRDHAFEGCRFLIEAIKRDVPIWKRELFDDAAAQPKENVYADV